MLHTEECHARVNTVAQPYIWPNNTYCPLSIHATSGVLCADGHNNTLHLTARELQLITLLIKQCGRPVSRSTIFEGFSLKAASRHAVDAHVYRLRTKLKDAFGTDYIVSVPELGWQIDLVA
jgi:DNA-binding response OmpR family regulator